MEDQYSHGAANNPNYCAFMLTTQEDSQVDYRNPWKNVGKGPFKPSNHMQTMGVDESNFNKFSTLEENDVEVDLVNVRQNGGVEECTDKHHTIPLQDDVPRTKLCVADFPIPVPEARFPARVKMPRMPRVSKQKKFKSGCDGDTMNMRQFDSLLKSEYKKSCCQDTCCSDEPNTQELMELSISSDTQSEPINSIPQEIFIDTEVKLRSMATSMMENSKRQNLDIPPHIAKLAESELNLITPTTADSSVLNLNQKIV